MISCCHLLFRFQLAQGLGAPVQDVYPPLFDCRIPFTVPALTRDVRAQVTQILISALSHHVNELAISSKSLQLNLESGNKVQVGQYLRCQDNEHFVCVSEADGLLKFRLKNPEYYGQHKCFCKKLLDKDEDTDEDTDEEEEEYSDHSTDSEVEREDETSEDETGDETDDNDINKETEMKQGDY